MEGSLLSDGSGGVGQEAKAKLLSVSVLGKSLVMLLVEQMCLLLLGLWTICFGSCRFYLPHLLGMWVCAAHFTNFLKIEVIWRMNLGLSCKFLAGLLAFFHEVQALSHLTDQTDLRVHPLMSENGVVGEHLSRCPSHLSLPLFFSGSSLSHVDLVLSALLYLSHKLSPIYL